MGVRWKVRRIVGVSFVVAGLLAVGSQIVRLDANPGLVALGLFVALLGIVVFAGDGEEA